MKKSIAFILSLSIFLFVASTSSAQLIEGDALKGMQDTSNEVRMSSGLSSTASVGSIIAAIIRTALGLLAAIFLVLMIFAGVQWMTAAGNESKIGKAQETIKAALIGLIIVLAAYAITYFVFRYLPFTGSTGGSSSGGLTTSP